MLTWPQPHTQSQYRHPYQCAVCSDCPCTYVQSVHTIPSWEPVSGVDIKQTQMKHVIQHNNMQTHTKLKYLSSRLLMELDVLASMRTGHGWYSLEEVPIHVQYYCIHVYYHCIQHIKRHFMSRIYYIHLTQVTVYVRNQQTWQGSDHRCCTQHSTMW